MLEDVFPDWLTLLLLLLLRQRSLGLKQGSYCRKAASLIRAYTAELGQVPCSSVSWYTEFSGR